MRGQLTFLLAKLVPAVLGLLTTAILTRLLQPVEYGLYALGLSMIFFLTIGIFEWLGLSVLRMAPTVEAPQAFFDTVMTCLCTLAVLCTACTVVVIGAGGFGAYAGLAAASLLATFASAWLELKQRLQLAELRETHVMWTCIGRGVVSLIFVCTATAFFRSAAASLFSLAAALLLVGLMVWEPRLAFPQWRFHPAIFRTLFRFGFPLAVSVGLATILMSVDKWLLQSMLGPGAVGLFTAATLVAQVPILALAGSIGPWSYSVAVRALEFRSVEAAKAELERNFVVLFGAVLPGAVGTAALSANLAHLVLGPAYWETAAALAPWLAAGAVLSSVRAFYVDFAFQLGRRTSPLIWTTLAAVCINVVLDLLLIPRFGLVGAAAGSLCACRGQPRHRSRREPAGVSAPRAAGRHGQDRGFVCRDVRRGEQPRPALRRRCAGTSGRRRRFLSTAPASWRLTSRKSADGRCRDWPASPEPDLDVVGLSSGPPRAQDQRLRLPQHASSA